MAVTENVVLTPAWTGPGTLGLAVTRSVICHENVTESVSMPSLTVIYEV